MVAVLKRMRGDVAREKTSPAMRMTFAHTNFALLHPWMD